MKRKLFQMIVLTGVTAASSVVMADQSGLRVVIPMPPPTSRPSEADLSAVTDAQQLVDNARKDAGIASAALIRAQVNLDRITRSLQSQPEASGEMTGATNAVADAKATHEKLVQPILASLAEREPYREARAALAKAQQAADEVRALPDAAIEKRIAAAQAVLDAKAAAAQIENAAFDDNVDVVNAKKKYLEATQHLREMRQQLWQAIRQYPAYVEASRAVDDARERLAAADQQLAAAKQNLFAAHRQLAAKQESRQQIVDWTYQHGLPEPP